MKQIQKRMLLALGSLMLMGSLAACGNQPAASTTPAKEAAPASAAAPEELTVALDWYPNAVHSFLYAAEEQGYFKEENLKVTLQMPSDANDPLKMVAAGKIDTAISYQQQVVQARSESIPVVSLAALVRHPLNIIMVREDSGIKSPKDLAGKQIGYPSVPLDEAIVRNVVKADGGDDSGLTFTDIGFDIIPALTSKRVDAVVGGYINHEKPILEKNGVPVIAFEPRQFGVPDYYELVLTTSDDTLAKKEKALAGFLRAIAKGQAYVKENPEAALKLLLSKQAQEFPLEADIETKSLEILLPLMDARSDPFGTQSEESWQTMIDWMKKEKLIQGDVTVDQVMKNVAR